jgi:hypothetical protein
MKSEEIKQLVADFELNMQVIDNVECWSARIYKFFSGIVNGKTLRR